MQNEKYVKKIPILIIYNYFLLVTLIKTYLSLETVIEITQKIIQI